MDITQLLRFGVDRRASDILITANSPPVVRLNGELTVTKATALTPTDTRSLVYSVLTDSQKAKFEAEKELDFSLSFQEKYRFRGNAYIQRGCVAANFRLIPSEIPSLDDLNLPPIIEEFALLHQGLMIVSGPTGHGKTTTQAAMINIVNNTRPCHIVTVEDPIEFVHVNNKSVVDQREVGDDTLSFASALKHVLRQDPDVILVGEMRDLETVATVLTAAETGHLVIATLHTNDAVQSIDRMIDVFPPHQQQQVRSQLALCLLAVVSQRLLPRADRTGRIVAVEIMRNIPAVGNLIREAKIHNVYTVMETQSKAGMQTMDSAIKALYLKGLITYEEAKQRMRDPKMLDLA